MWRRRSGSFLRRCWLGSRSLSTSNSYDTQSVTENPEFWGISQNKELQTEDLQKHPSWSDFFLFSLIYWSDGRNFAGKRCWMCQAGKKRENREYFQWKVKTIWNWLKKYLNFEFRRKKTVHSTHFPTWTRYIKSQIHKQKHFSGRFIWVQRGTVAVFDWNWRNVFVNCFLFWFSFYRTQVSPKSDLWVSLSLTE